ATVIAGNGIDAETDQLGHEEPRTHILDQLGDGDRARFEPEIGRGRAGRATRPAGGVAGRGEGELAAGTEIEEPGRQHPVFDDGTALVGNALAVERLGAETARAVRIVDDDTAARKDLTAKRVLEEGRLAGNGVAVYGPGEMTKDAASDAAV